MCFNYFNATASLSVLYRILMHGHISDCTHRRVYEPADNTQYKHHVLYPSPDLSTWCNCFRINIKLTDKLCLPYEDIYIYKKDFSRPEVKLNLDASDLLMLTYLTFISFTFVFPVYWFFTCY